MKPAYTEKGINLQEYTKYWNHLHFFLMNNRNEEKDWRENRDVL